MKIILVSLTLVFLIFSSLFAFMMAVNFSSPPPIHLKKEDRRTRFCHDKGRPHPANGIGGKLLEPLYETVGRLYLLNLEALKKQKLTGYREINILIYVIIWPLLMFILTITALYQQMIIRKLRRGKE